MAAGARTFDERFAALDERVTNLRSSFTSLEASTSRGFSNIEAQFNSLSSEIRSSQRTPWGVIWTALGVGVAILGLIGAILYSPLKDDVNVLKANDIHVSDAINQLALTIPDKFVGRAELDQRVARAADDRKALTDTLNNLSTEKLNRSEWQLRNDAVNNLVADLNRRVEELRQELVSIAGPRDALEQINKRLDRLEISIKSIP